MKKITLAGVAAAALALGGCSLSGSTHQSAQAGPTDHSPADVLQMPSGFRNVSLKCFNLQGEWFAVASVSDGGNSDNKDGAVGITPDPKCTHDGS